MKLTAPLRIATIKPNDREPGAASVHVSEEQGTIVVHVHGEIDIVTSPELERVMRLVTATASASVVIDLQRVRFMDSSGLHVIRASREALLARGCFLHVRNAPRNVRRLFVVGGAEALLAS